MLSLPPGHFIAGLMQLPMMAAAERHRELIADFEAEGSRLRKPQVMRIGRLTSANEAWLRGNKPQMRLCHEVVWVRQLSERSCRSCRGRDLALAGAIGGAATEDRAGAVRSRKCSVTETAIVDGHSSATGAELALCRRAESRSDGAVSVVAGESNGFCEYLALSIQAQARTVFRTSPARVWWRRFPRP